MPNTELDVVIQIEYVTDTRRTAVTAYDTATGEPVALPLPYPRHDFLASGQAHAYADQCAQAYAAVGFHVRRA